MRVGAVFPQTEIGEDPVAVVDFAQAAENLGFSHLLLFDHVLGVSHEDRDGALEGPYTDAHGFHEVLTLSAYLAGLTNTIELATGVLVLPQRETALVAKQTAQVQIFSRGRLRLGVGSGWNPIEYRGLNADYESRGRRLDEQITVLQRLWTEDLVSFKGDWHDLDRVGIAPAPSAAIPIWFGGWSEAAFRRAARVGDGFMFSRPGATPGEWRFGGRRGQDDAMFDGARRVLELVEAAGRDAASFGIEGRTHYNAGGVAWRADLDAMVVAGFTHAALNTMNSGLTPADHIVALETYASEVGLV